jgi:hypothetical protein
VKWENDSAKRSKISLDLQIFLSVPVFSEKSGNTVSNMEVTYQRKAGVGLCVHFSSLRFL